MKNSFRRISFAALLLAAVLLFGGGTAYADLFLQPEPFEIWSEDGTMVFRWCPGPDESWMLVGAVQAGSEEVPSSWAQEAVERAGELGILPDTFRAGFGRSTTRAEFASIAVALYEHFGGSVTGRATFADTTDVSVEKAAYLGIVSGVGNNRFDPSSPLTREQAAVMLVRLFFAIHANLGTDLPVMLELPYLPEAFTDYEQVASWAFDSVASVSVLGIMGGVGNNRFDPGGSYTIEQSIVTILRLFDMVSAEL